STAREDQTGTQDALLRQEASRPRECRCTGPHAQGGHQPSEEARLERARREYPARPLRPARAAAERRLEACSPPFRWHHAVRCGDPEAAQLSWERWEP